MNERDEKEYQSLNDVLDAGFARVAAEEAAADDAQAQADADAQVMADEAAAVENAQIPQTLRRCRKQYRLQWSRHRFRHKTNRLP